MLRYVLDTNCIIDLEEARENSSYLKVVIEEWKKRTVELAIVAVSASENQQNGGASQSYSDFESKLKGAGLTGIEELLPIGKWDVFFWDHFIWSDDENEILEQQIRDVLFPGVTTLPPNDIQANSKWRNQMCDVLIAWSCSHHGWETLVTSDQNFHKKSEELKRFGINEVLYPEQAANRARP